MDEFSKEIIQGRKTFFISPDKSLFPESYLEEYLTQGFECYFITGDIFLPLEIKINILVSTFEDCIIFFNIDSPVQNNDWPVFIEKIQRKYPNNLFGVIYEKRKFQNEKEKIERTYLLDIGIKCGATQLEYQKSVNFELIARLLFANQAMGRRKSVRAVLKGGCTVQFLTANKISINTKLMDISITHFSFIADGSQAAEIQEHEKIMDAHFYLKGLHFRSNAILLMKRPVPTGTLCVFAFFNDSGQLGLESYTKGQLVPKIYSILNENIMALLDSLFKQAYQAMLIQKRTMEAQAAAAAAEENPN